MTKKEGNVPTNIKKDIQILENLKRIYYLEKENIFVMLINIKEILRRIKKKEMELIFIMMEINMKKILRMIKLMVREFMKWKMGLNMKVDKKMTKLIEKILAVMKDFLKMIKILFK